MFEFRSAVFLALCLLQCGWMNCGSAYNRVLAIGDCVCPMLHRFYSNFHLVAPVGGRDAHGQSTNTCIVTLIALQFLLKLGNVTFAHGVPRLFRLRSTQFCIARTCADCSDPLLERKYECSVNAARSGAIAGTRCCSGVESTTFDVEAGQSECGRRRATGVDFAGHAALAHQSKGSCGIRFGRIQWMFHVVSGCC
jgi:hypothetical protein